MPDTDYRVEGRVMVATVIPDDVGIISREAHRAIDAIGEGEFSLVIDFNGIKHFPGSTSLQTLTRIRNKLRKRGGTVLLCSVSPAMLSLFTMTQMDRLFHIATDVEDAFAHIAGQAGRAGHVRETEGLKTNTKHNIPEEVFTNRLEGYSRLEEPEKETPSPPPAGQQTPAAALRSLAASWPADVNRRAAALAAAHLAYREAYAEQLEPVVNARIRQAIEGGTSYDQKRQIAKSINEDLRLGGLSVRCEVSDGTGQSVDHPGLLVADTSRQDAGRFRVEYQDADGKNKRLGLLSGPDFIKLMPSPSRQNRELSQTPHGTFVERFGTQPAAPRESDKLR